MAVQVKMTEKDLLLACSILVFLRDGEELLYSEIKRKSGLTSIQTERLLKFLRGEYHILPRTVPEKNKILAKYGITKRGLSFLEDMVAEYGKNQTIAFTLGGKELKDAFGFIKNHKCDLKDESRTGGKKVGAIGGRIGYRFTPTSLGIAALVKCACGKEKDVTDYDSW